MLHPVAESYLHILASAASVSHSKNKEAASIARGIWRGLRGSHIYDVSFNLQGDAALIVKECLDNPSYTVPSMTVPLNSLFLGVDLDITKTMTVPRHDESGLVLSCARAIGYLLRSSKDCWVFLQCEYTNGSSALLPLEVYAPDDQRGVSGPLYAMLAVLSRAIESPTTRVLKDMPEFGLAMRHSKKSLGMSKVLLPTPPPFYEIEADAAKLREGIYPMRFTFMRGELPVSAKRLAWLRKRGYVLFSGSMADATKQILDGLEKNGVWAPEPWEWLAVKVTRELKLRGKPCPFR